MSITNLAVRTALFAAALFVAGCEPTYRVGREPVRHDPQNGPPEWVAQPPLDSRYVYGVGADLNHDRTRAIADGRRDIARQLGIIIRGDEQEAEDVELEAENPGTRPRVSIDHLELPGITVTKQTDTPRCLYVQVALNREAWATGLRGRIDELDNALRASIAQPADPGATPVATTARLYQRLMPLVQEREDKASHLQIADPGGRAPVPPESSAGLRERLARTLDAVIIDLVADPSLEPIIPQLTAACANLGLRIAPGAEKPVLRLKLTLVSTSLVADGMERLDGTFQCTVLSGRDAGNLGGIRITLRSSGVTDTVARDRLMRKILTRWSEYLEQDFVSYLTRL
jgi:hypothetical protein